MAENPHTVKFASPNEKDSCLRVWSKTKLSSKPPLTLTGYSRSTDRTYFYIPELKLGLDAGTARKDVIPDVILLSHTHDDHLNQVPYHVQKKRGIRIYCPKAAVRFVDNFIKASISADNCAEWSDDMASYELEGLEAGNQFFFGKKNQFRVTALECLHSVPCIGFLVDERRTKLKQV
eukprot:TRINITY_DN2012_c0_g2_i20.p1 TRINITY_DN2012_c0_g2~~TRINITY_DN2012_c0_g2_i20.p1  ORF type:complete len:177 (+),score=28.96 TRINITY_DN2012_c0_g2_i20:68-598(+)